MSQLEFQEQAVYVYALSMLPEIGKASLLSILKAFPLVQILHDLPFEELKKELGSRVALKLRTGLDSQWKQVFPAAQKLIDLHIEKGIDPLPYTSDEYPDLLKLIADPPAILYTKGDRSVLNTMPAIAVVGTRSPTAYGLQTTKIVAYQFAKSGYAIVSGLAKGTDTAAHLGAIKAGGKTIAVVATPLDQIYPAENKKLAAEI